MGRQRSASNESHILLIILARRIFTSLGSLYIQRIPANRRLAGRDILSDQSRGRPLCRFQPKNRILATGVSLRAGWLWNVSARAIFNSKLVRGDFRRHRLYALRLYDRPRFPSWDAKHRRLAANRLLFSDARSRQTQLALGCSCWNGVRRNDSSRTLSNGRFRAIRFRSIFLISSRT